MFILDDVDVYSHRGVEALMDRIDAQLDELDTKRQDPRRFLQEALVAPCTDARIGVFLELFGIDRIAYWQDLTPEEFADAVPELRPEDLDLIRKAPEHLASCRKCLAESYRYAHFISEHLFIVRTMATDGLESYLAAGPLSAEEAQRFHAEMTAIAYTYLVSVDRMRQREEMLATLQAVPCTKPRLTKRFEVHGIINTSERLLMSNHALARESRRRNLSPEKRYARLQEMSAHLTGCQRCALQYGYEKREERYQQQVYGLL